MMPRFITKLEQEYSQKFPGCKEAEFFHETKKEAYFSLLKNALKRGEPVTHEEMVELWGEEAYKREQAYLKQWDDTDGK